ncbi:MAG: [NiFe]-hydrogenase assembly chaperone HybE, partial [Gammaproteobacteria bacterium]
MTNEVTQLVERFRIIHAERMADLPLCNPRLEVEAVGFREFEDLQLGVLITPWFMNLVLLSGEDAWADWPQGSKSEWTLPAGTEEFTTGHDDEIPTYLTAVLFRTVQDFADQDMARAVAERVMENLFVEPEPDHPSLSNEKPV